MANTWVHSSPYAQLPPFAVIGGHDCDGSPIYVGRSNHEGDNLPAKVIPSKGTAYVAWGGREITKSHYEVLVGEGYGWVPCFGGSVPPNAVRTGNTVTGEPLYVGRGHHANSLTVGKIHPSHGCLYIPFGGQEIRVSTYEVLVQESRDKWVASTPNYTPPGAVIAGHDTDRATIYVGRAMHEEYKWLHSSVYSSIPPNAVAGGNDADGAIMYVGRSFHQGDMLVAKILPTKHIAYVSWRGEEIQKDHFEVLCGTSLAWRHCYDHIIPENAVLCGNTALEQPVYIGRGYYEGSLTVGKVSSVHRALFIAFGGAERRLNSYEILVDEKSSIDWSLPTPPPPEPLIEKPNPPLIELLESKPPIYAPLPEVKPPIGFVPVPSYEPPPPYAPSAPLPYPSTIPTPIYPPAEIPPKPVFTPAEVSPTPAPTPVFSPAQVAPTPVPTPVFTPAQVAPPPVPTPIFTPAEVAPPPVPTPIFTPAEVAGIIPPRTHDLWVPASYNFTPPNAVHAGHDSDLSSLLVCRAFHAGEMIPGKAVPSRGYAYVSHAGQEIPLSNYEILVGDRYHWVSATDGNIPPGAVEAGHTTNGEPLYVGRAHYCGSLTPGKIQRSHYCLYIPYNGREVRVSQYEALVRSDEFYRGQGMLY